MSTAVLTHLLAANVGFVVGILVALTVRLLMTYAGPRCHLCGGEIDGGGCHHG